MFTTRDYYYLMTKLGYGGEQNKYTYLFEPFVCAGVFFGLLTISGVKGVAYRSMYLMLRLAKCILNSRR